MIVQILDNPFKGYFEKNESGSGIGLMIVKKIMEAHKGTVNIYNNDQGAVVELLFNK